MMKTIKKTSFTTDITCCICGKSRTYKNGVLAALKRNGQTEFTCGKRKCSFELRSRNVKAARTTDASRAKTSAASKVSWEANHDLHVAAAIKGMKASKKYMSKTRIAKSTATKKANPKKCSDAIKKAWLKRPRQVITSVTFKCDQCGTHNTRELKPDKYENFKKAKHHFCNEKCNAVYRSEHAPKVTLQCEQCGTDIVKRKALVDYLRKTKKQEHFFCTNLCQRMYQDQNFDPTVSKLERIVEDFLVESGITFEAQKFIHLTGKSRPQRWTVPDFVVGNTIIFVDGCAVHGCKKCGKPGFKSNMVKDPKITKTLRAMGYKVLRIKEHELKSNAWKTKLKKAL